MSQTPPTVLPIPTAPDDNRFRVMILEEDEALAAQIVGFIERTGFEIRLASDVEMGRTLFDLAHPHLLVLRVSNGGLDAHAFCRWVRGQSGIPIVTLGPANEAAEIAALKIGSDDYVPMPLRPAVLLARCVARLRRVYRYNTPVRETEDQNRILPGFAECRRCDYIGPRANFEKEDLLGNIKMVCPRCNNSDDIVISID